MHIVCTNICIEQFSVFYVSNILVHTLFSLIIYDRFSKILFDIPNNLGGHKLTDVLNFLKISGGGTCPLALIARRPCLDLVLDNPESILNWWNNTFVNTITKDSWISCLDFMRRGVDKGHRFLNLKQSTSLRRRLSFHFALPTQIWKN